jgi:hypothetical protein
MTPLDVDDRLGRDAGQRAVPLGFSGDAAHSPACRRGRIPLMNRPLMRPVSLWHDGKTWVQQMTRSERNNHEEDE